MAEPLRVVHVVLSLDVGGLERIVIGLIREGRRLGQDVRIICLEREGTLAEEARAAGALVMSMDKTPGRSAGLPAQLGDLLSRWKADVVHTHQISALWYCGRALRGARRPILVHTEHSDHLSQKASWRSRWQRRALMFRASRFARRFFCVADSVAAAATAFHVVRRKIVEVVPNGIDLDAFGESAAAGEVRNRIGAGENDLIVGTVGRLTEVKRQDVLIRAFASACDSVPGARLLLVGDGPAAVDLKSLVGELLLNDRVHFAGYQSNPAPYLQAMDIFALTSRVEGMPVSVLEAWACGLPVVASKVGGLPRLVSSGDDGLLYDFGDEAALVAHLRRLMESADLRRRMGEAGRAKVEQDFTIARTAGTYDRHYRELLGIVETRPQAVNVDASGLSPMGMNS